ncbi:MAG: DUF4198 domain-containing protein [Desulfosarcina sp.]|nr:DUF4198 domain-containing protein [Desulfobacterales bacterium]
MTKVTTILFKVLLTAIMIAVLPVAGFGHNLWFNAIDYTPAFSKRTGAHTKIYFGFGHKFPVDDFLDKGKLIEFKLIKPDGKSQDLEPGEGGFLATPLIIKKEGAHIVSAATAHGFYTMYMKNGRMHHKIGTKKGLEKVILSLYYENYTKALINVGKTPNDAYSTPVGHGIEIVPMENPYLKKAGDTLKLKVLYKGHPAPFCNVFATYAGFSSTEDYAFTNKTNGQGISKIRILKPGHWIVKTVVRKPAKKELQDKCIEEKYSATISFEVS